MGIMTGYRIYMYRALEQVPQGKVITGPDLAKLAGSPGARRATYRILRQEESRDYPYWRVVTEDGELVDGIVGGAEEQKQKLQEEGVSVEGNKVSLDEVQFRPDLEEG